MRKITVNRISIQKELLKIALKNRTQTKQLCTYKWIIDSWKVTLFLLVSIASKLFEQEYL